MIKVSTCFIRGQKAEYLKFQKRTAHRVNFNSIYLLVCTIYTIFFTYLHIRIYRHVYGLYGYQMGSVLDDWIYCTYTLNS
jgi:hypothetical protein